MSKKGSLVSSSDYDSIGRKGGRGSSSSGGGMTGQDKIKIGVAAALLVVAGLILAWYYGLVDTTPAPPPPSAEEVQQFQQRQAEIQQDIDAGRIAQPGAE